MERLRPRKEFGVTLEQAIRHDFLREQYLTERYAAIREGEAVWKVRNFHWLDASEDEGPVLDYYSENNHRGFIEGNERFGFQVYATPHELGEPPHHLNAETVELESEAKKKLEDYIRDTSI
jgi:hypothetical protein